MASGLSIITAGYFITVIIWTKVLKSIIPTRTMTSGMIKVVHFCSQSSSSISLHSLFPLHGVALIVILMLPRIEENQLPGFWIGSYVTNIWLKSQDC